MLWESTCTLCRITVSVLRNVVETCIFATYSASGKSSAPSVTVFRINAEFNISCSLPNLSVNYIDLIEVVIADQYVSRSDQWRYKQRLITSWIQNGGTVFSGMHFTFAKIAAQIRYVSFSLSKRCYWVFLEPVIFQEKFKMLFSNDST